MRIQTGIKVKMTIKSLSGNRAQSRARRRASRTRRLTEVRLVCLSREDNTVMRSPPSAPFGTGLSARPALSARSSDAPDIGLRSLPRHAHPTATVAAMSYFRIGSKQPAGFTPYQPRHDDLKDSLLWASGVILLAFFSGTIIA